MKFINKKIAINLYPETEGWVLGYSGTCIWFLFRELE